jgi:antitoxin component YwqK of YwqJK toxin-antitoxin module
MNFRHLITICFLILPVTLLCQPETGLNRVDQNGKKQGHWIKKYPNNNIMYDGIFKDNYPEGEFKRYFDDETLRSVMIFTNNGLDADARIYHQNGFLSAKGRYSKQKKEGLWQFYSEFASDYLVSEEMYSGNLKNGKSVKFYPDGTIAEKLNFVNDTAQGEWIKYYPDGTVCLKSTLQNGMINGKFETWFDNNNPHFSGEYRNDRREGIWLIYEREGNLKYKMEYINGITNDRSLDIDNEKYLNSLEENKGKIPDPEKTGEIW